MNIKELSHAQELHLKKKIILRIPHARVTYQNGIIEQRSHAHYSRNKKKFTFDLTKITIDVKA